MCGICGVVYSDQERPVDQDMLRRMMGSLRHRGPDGEGIFPPALKTRGSQEKYILRHAMRQDLPPEIRERKKRGLASPYRRWLRDPPDSAVELLSADQVRRRGYFDPGVVAEMLEQHRAGRAGYGKSLLGVLAIHLWDDLFMKPEGPGMAPPA